MEAVPFLSLVQELGQVMLKNIKKRCFLLQKPVQKKSQVFLCLELFVFFPVGHYWVMLQEDA